MPLTMMKIGEEMPIKKITGNDDTKRFLGRLGIFAGEKVSIISEITGNMIISVKDCRVAIDKNIAKRILV